jgi:hypothetical protein
MAVGGVQRLKGFAENSTAMILLLVGGGQQRGYHGDDGIRTSFLLRDELRSV